MVTIKDATKKDIELIVEVHLSAFAGFFLTDLGPKFLRLYYQSVLKAPDGILLIAVEDNKIIGFCATCTKSAGFNSRLITHNAMRFIKEALRLMISSPKSLLRLFKNITKKADISDDGEYAEVLSIGVLKDAQGQGLGKLLLDNLFNRLQKTGISQISLTTDYEENEKTLRFYESIGFKKKYKFITYPQRKMYRLIKTLSTLNNE